MPALVPDSKSKNTRTGRKTPTGDLRPIFSHIPTVTQDSFIKNSDDGPLKRNWRGQLLPQGGNQIQNHAEKTKSCRVGI
jgi:hypothetical protein